MKETLITFVIITFLSVFLLTIFLPIVSYASVVDTGLSFDIADTGNTAGSGIASNDTHILICDATDAEVYVYYHNGTYTSTHWDTNASGVTRPNGITMNDSYVWLTDYWTQKVYQFYVNGTDTGNSWNTTSNNFNPVELTNNDTHIWIIDWTDDGVYQYYSNGTYTGVFVDTSTTGNSAPNGIIEDDPYIWIADSDNEIVYQYYMNLAPTGLSWTLSTNSVLGITKNNSVFWTLGNIDNKVYKYYNNVIPVTTSLLTELQINPTSISTNASTPYLSWIYTDPNETQSSYEIYVGTSLGASDMWNSQISSSNTYTTYAGITLEEITTYYIQVRTNDGYENSDWITGTFELKDTTAYSPPPTTGGTSSLDIYSEKISTPRIITEKITDTFSETDSFTFVLYLIGALLGALIFGIISNNDNMINVVLTGTVGWIVTLILVVINNLLEIIVIDSVITMILSVTFGFTIYAIHDQCAENTTKSKPKRRPKK